MAIWRPTDDTPLIPLRTPFGLLADSVEAALADTGWVNCSLISPWTGTCIARKVGLTVDVRVDITGGSVVNGGGTTFANLPGAIPNPSRAHVRAAGMASSKNVAAYVTTSGDIGFTNFTGGTVTAVTASATYLAG